MNASPVISAHQQLDETDLLSTRQLLQDAFEGDFTQSDWEHTFGGIRFISRLNSSIIAHAAVVSREVRIDGLEHSIGYIEGLAVIPQFQGNGFGKALMSQVTHYCFDEFNISMLSTGEKPFYRSLGWRDFLGQSFVTHNGALTRTEDEDEGLMILSKESERYVRSMIACYTRSGDAW